MSDKKFQNAVDRAIAEVNADAIEEKRAIDACNHSRATVEDHDQMTDREGNTIPGFFLEYIDCPDCPLSDWFSYDPKMREEV